MEIASVIICFHPDVQHLEKLCRSLLAGNSSVILVDNSEPSTLSTADLPNECKIIEIGYNAGIAHAQNVGVEFALENGAQRIAMFDQDSTIDDDFLPLLCAQLTPGEPKITSPLYIDEDDNSALPSQRISKYGLPYTIHSDNSATPYNVDVIIASGTVATKEVFSLAGSFDDRLFIDYVDTEWCLRCRSKDIPIFVVPSVKMRHKIGSKSHKFGPLTVLVHSPVRCYYQIRNGIHLFRYPHVPLLFAIKENLAVILSRIILLFFVKSRLKYISAMAHGFRDGILGRYGKYRG